MLDGKCGGHSFSRSTFSASDAYISAISDRNAFLLDILNSIFALNRLMMRLVVMVVSIVVTTIDMEKNGTSADIQFEPGE